jgi:hypothetical protein
MHHRPARMARERRQTPPTSVPSTSATAVVDANPPSYTSAVNLTVPTTTTALAVVVAVLCLVILLGALTPIRVLAEVLTRPRGRNLPVPEEAQRKGK